MAARNAAVRRFGAVCAGPLMAAAVAAAASAQDRPVLDIQAPPGLEEARARLSTFNPDRLAAIVRLVGLGTAGDPITVVLAPESSEIARQLPDWIAGVALAERDTIVLMPARSPSYPHDTLEDVLHHEVAHILIARAAGGRPIPRWLHEGLAMYAEQRWGFDDRRQLVLAAWTERQIAFRDLDELFRGGRSENAHAYALSAAMVRDLVREYGAGVGARILRGISGGLSFETAFVDATGQSWWVAEAAFWERQSVWSRWIPLVTSSAALWGLITLLALFAIRRQRERREERRRRWAAEDAAIADGPEGSPALERPPDD